ncbi:cerebellar degeneration-related protein 2 [Sinocyclocheilus rhinocerous]|uniref:cerebellar degeneration-related protein 2 n=1 Tax=Sinocyclocheilus rhinocerous TaxID=307959 RepID=UPI0007B8AAB5|nr:PREDICTED: cerebellar degeneration-related protein 2-like [Sinocyclocheilus rhinocerous]
MLTDITEGEFDIKEEEPWYDHQDLEHDLHLAAELGKNLLEQNRDLEETLQQMCITNQEQIQEIEYLSKQVDMLRSANDQQAKLYEQLDSTAQDLELKNQRLVLENRAAQMKIEGLTETVEGLQTQVEELQRDMQKLKLDSAEQNRSRDRDPDSVQGLTCCEEKCQLHKYFSHERSVSTSRSSLKREEQDEYWELKRSVDSLQAQLSTERAQRETAELEADALVHELSQLEPKKKYFSHERSVSTSRSSLKREEQDEYWELKRSVDSLQAQLSTERAQRETAELEADALVHELSQLEPKVALLGVYKEHLAEKEAEVQELRLLLRSSEDNVFLPLDDEVGGAGHRGRCCSGERQLLSDEQPAVKHHGISLLNEVDAQYTALQEKYDTLLRRCNGGMLSEKQKTGQTRTHSPGVNTQNDSQQPEYKALFQEIFTFIQKSQKDLKENRINPGQVE